MPVNPNWLQLFNLWCWLVFFCVINDDGLSYIEDYHEVMTFPKINSDLFVMAYATYVAALADASLQDNQQDASLFAFLQRTLEVEWKRVWIIKF